VEDEIGDSENEDTQARDDSDEEMDSGRNSRGNFVNIHTIGTQK
jgi:hypothetical protein